MSIAMLSYVLAWGAVVGFLGLWGARTVVAERQAGHADAPVQRGRVVRRLDVGLAGFAVVAGGACVLRMLLVLDIVG